MELPSADHVIAIEPFQGRVSVIFADQTIATSEEALTLREDGHPTRYYFPKHDVDMEKLRKTVHETACPFKGQASYYSIHARGRVADNAAWSYEDPFPAVAEIAGYLAFYPDRVDAIVGPKG